MRTIPRGYSFDGVWLQIQALICAPTSVLYSYCLSRVLPPAPTAPAPMSFGHSSHGGTSSASAVPVICSHDSQCICLLEVIPSPGPLLFSFLLWLLAVQLSASWGASPVPDFPPGLH